MSRATDVAIVFRNAGAFDPRRAPRQLHEYRAVELNGAYISPEVVHLDAADGTMLPEITLDDAQNSTGEWFGVFRHVANPHDYVVAADPFGYMSTYYRLVKRDGRTDVLVATSARAMTSIQRYFGLSVALDWTQLASALASDHIIATTPFSDYSMAQGVNVLKPGELLVVGKGGVTVEQLPHFENAHGASYEDLLRTGADRAIALLARVSSLPVQHRINLSGGKDSRVMLAMIAASGQAQNFQVDSTNPMTWSNRASRPALIRDLVLADALRSHYGMEWLRRPEVDILNVSYTESLNDWQNFRSGWNMAFRPQTQVFVERGLSTALRGATGEAFRSSGAIFFEKDEGFQKTGDSEETFVEAAEAAFGVVFDHERIPPGHADEAKVRFLRTFQSLGGGTGVEAASRYWTAYRNRGHFGHVRHSLTRGALPIFPLAQKEFMQAGQLLPVEDKKDGRVLFDLMEMLEPKLNTLEFESGPWPDRYVEAQKGDGQTWDVAASFDDLDAFHEAALYDVERRARARVDSPGDISVEPAERFLAGEIREVVAELRSVPGGSEFLSADAGARMAQLARRNEAAAGVLLSKLHTARDVFAGRAPGRFTVIELDEKEQMSGNAYLHKPTSVRFPPGWRTDLGTLSQELSITSTHESKIVAAVTVTQEREGQLEHAFYLNRDGRKIDEQWYSPLNSATFDRPGDGLEGLSITAFTRVAGSSEPLYFTSRGVGE